MITFGVALMYALFSIGRLTFDKWWKWLEKSRYYELVFTIITTVILVIQNWSGISGELKNQASIAWALIVIVLSQIYLRLPAWQKQVRLTERFSKFVEMQATIQMRDLIIILVFVGGEVLFLGAAFWLIILYLPIQWNQAFVNGTLGRIQVVTYVDVARGFLYLFPVFYVYLGLWSWPQVWWKWRQQLKKKSVSP